MYEKLHYQSYGVLIIRINNIIVTNDDRTCIIIIKLLYRQSVCTAGERVNVCGRKQVYIWGGGLIWQVRVIYNITYTQIGAYNLSLYVSVSIYICAIQSISNVYIRFIYSYRTYYHRAIYLIIIYIILIYYVYGRRT